MSQNYAQGSPRLRPPPVPPPSGSPTKKCHDPLRARVSVLFLGPCHTSETFGEKLPENIEILDKFKLLQTEIFTFKAVCKN
jgi:hypothetical protein